MSEDMSLLSIRYSTPLYSLCSAVKRNKKPNSDHGVFVIHATATVAIHIDILIIVIAVYDLISLNFSGFGEVC